ncbi:hypothetical protein HOY82DRAFT_486950 [Tuber indicum]|nr:hypothetical protein HOY82DRAFT_486950 [Tuber indicum]
MQFSQDCEFLQLLVYTIGLFPLVPKSAAILHFLLPCFISLPLNMLGKIAHYSFDAILFSAFLAGVKRSTGLTFQTEKIESKDVRSAIDKYLNIGEWFMDQSIAVMGSSNYFERRR